MGREGSRHDGSPHGGECGGRVSVWLWLITTASAAAVAATASCAHEGGTTGTTASTTSAKGESGHWEKEIVMFSL